MKEVKSLEFEYNRVRNIRMLFKKEVYRLITKYKLDLEYQIKILKG